MDFGTTFRAIRKQRNLSLQELSGDDISYSFLATFERGESMISFELLRLLLSKLQLSLDEFICISFVDNIETEYESFSKQAASFLYDKKSKELEDLAKLELERSKTNNHIFHKCNEIICKAVQSTFDPNTSISQSDKQFIVDYLWNIEIWTKYDLSVLNYSLNIIPVSKISIFIDDIWKSIPQDIYKDKLHTYKFNLLNSMISSLIDEGYFVMAKKWIKKLKTKLSNSQDFFEMIYLYMLELILEKKINPSKKVEQKFYGLKNVLLNMGATNYAHRLEVEWINC